MRERTARVRERSQSKTGAVRAAPVLSAPPLGYARLVQRYIALGVLGLVACARGGAADDIDASTSTSDSMSQTDSSGNGLTDGGTDSSTSGGVCGNGTVSGSETCDDSNTASNDGCSSACALEPTQTITLNALARSIPDNGYNGTLGSMACVDVVVPAWYTPAIASMTVTVGMAHNWVGDVTVKVAHPDNTTVTVMNRPGVVESADDGGSYGVGATGILSTLYPVTYSQGAATSAESMGSGGGTVCLNNANNCNWLPANGAAPAGTLAAFNTKTSTGTWKVCVGDSNSLDTGSIDRIVLTFQH